MAITSDGAVLYVSAFGSSKIGVYDTAQLESDTFVPDVANQIPVSGGGPSGLVLDEQRGRLYVLTRFDNSISIIDTEARAEIKHVPMHNPEPPSVTRGRRFLYDATFTSSHGDQACASCHVFGDFDGLAWDLGNPDANVMPNPGPFRGVAIEQGGPLLNLFTGQPADTNFHPMKGPMVTQSLRGMANHGPMHWRGDRIAGFDEPTAQPDSGTFNEVLNFKKFNVAFTDLVGRHEQIPDEDMQAFADFILQVTYPPNPIRNLDDSLTPLQQLGKDFFTGPIADPMGHSCEGCHRLDPNANAGVTLKPGFFGSDGAQTFEFETQLFKIPHLRNLYTKVGRFGQPEFFLLIPRDHEHMGDQIRGYGFIHDGSFDTVFRFMSVTPFIIPITPEGDEIRRGLEAFIMAFDSNLKPIVGQQITYTRDNRHVTGPRVDLLLSRAGAKDCDLVAKIATKKREVGYLHVGNGFFASDHKDAPLIPDWLLRSMAVLGKTPLTYTCVPPGDGERIGVDRDGDGHWDGDELHAGSDPSDPASVPHHHHH